MVQQWARLTWLTFGLTDAHSYNSSNCFLSRSAVPRSVATPEATRDSAPSHNDLTLSRVNSVEGQGGNARMRVDTDVRPSSESAVYVCGGREGCVIELCKHDVVIVYHIQISK